MEPAEPVQMNISQINTYREGLRWLYFDDDPKNFIEQIKAPIFLEEVLEIEIM